MHNLAEVLHFLANYLKFLKDILQLVSNLAILSYVWHVEKGRAWVSDPAAARSENVALPFLFAWFALFDAKKVTRRFIPGPPGGALVYNFHS